MCAHQNPLYPNMHDASFTVNSNFGLHSRLAFVQQHGRTLQQHAKDAQIFCLLCIDLDGLQNIRDERGPAVTDALLQVVSQRLAHATRSDDVLGRLDDEEFVCLLTDLRGTAQARLRVEGIIGAITMPLRVGQHTLQIGTSIGTAIYPRDGHTMPALLAHADKAMRGAQGQKLLLRRRAASAERVMESAMTRLA